MRLLPDTQAVLWLLTDDPRQSRRAAGVLDDPANEVLLSAVVVWEVAIKQALGKIDPPERLVERVLGAGAYELPVTLEHAEAVGSLPLHHGDPFDRLLVVQAQLEDAVLLSADPALRAYDVRVLW